MQDLIDTLSGNYASLSPQLRLAAKHVMDRPEDVALKSMRAVAADAGVAPSTMVRLAQASGFKSYDAFREPFQDSVRSGGTSFASRTEWLVQLAGEGDTGQLTGSMAEAVISNVENAFRGIETETLEEAAQLLRNANRVYV
ncbi:MAG: silent information regulator protein Sir2, partial [Pseudomonadota bacterium]